MEPNAIALNTHGDQDFEKQVQSLRNRMDKLPRRKNGRKAKSGHREEGSWSKIRGLIWWIEPARGAEGEWRSHIHAIVALDQRDTPRNPRCLILRWAHDLRAELPGKWSRERWESDRKYRDIIEHQDIQPLHCYAKSRLSSRVDSACNPVARMFDVMNLAEYSRSDRRKKSSKRGKRFVPMTPDDRAHITLLGLRLRGCKGVFYGLDSDRRLSLEKQLTAIDRSPSLRRQLSTQALQRPAEAASLVPPSKVEDCQPKNVSPPPGIYQPKIASKGAGRGERASRQMPWARHRPAVLAAQERGTPVTLCHWRNPRRQPRPWNAHGDPLATGQLFAPFSDRDTLPTLRRIEP